MENIEINPETVRENAQKILERVEKAAQRAGHPVTLVAASKMNDTPRVREAYEGGIRLFGENRVQEMEKKAREGAYQGAELHFIGHLQRNKVKNVVGKTDLIQSVDSEELIELIGRRAGELKIVQNILLEVNIGLEESKSGVPAEKVVELLEKASHFPSIFVRGLMTIPPNTGVPAETARYFQEMYNLFVDMGAKKYDNVAMSILSMGMSADFEEAIACGANMVRVGTGIFGARNYAKS